MFIRSLETAAQEFPDPDLVIIGAGAAGITLACELDGSGLTVWLLEAGSERPRGETSDNYAGSALAPHPDPIEFRRIGLGGTTSIWGGRCVPYDPIDFEQREHIPGSGWPIAYDEVARHYPKALEYCDAGAFSFTARDSIRKPREAIAGFDGLGRIQTDCIERYSLPTNFGSRYRARLADSRNVVVVPELRCVALNGTVVGDAIESIDVVDAAGQRRRVNAPRFVLATGGIEATRLLLASDPDGPGIGNASDHVGRWYQCHFECNFGRLVAKGTPVAYAFERTLDRVYCRRKLLFTAEAQRQHRLLNTAFRLHFPDFSDASHRSGVMSLIFLAKVLLIAEYRAILRHGGGETAGGSRLAHIRNVVLGLPSILKFIWEMRIKRAIVRRKVPYMLVPHSDGSYPLEFNCEQTPQADSRITLLPERDTHGLPKVKVEWKHSEADVEAACRAFRLLGATIAEGSDARLEYDDSRLQQRLAAAVPLGGHHIGTTRMAASAADGVVDGNCALFEKPNLYIASSAVFPTSSHANPTLTIVAMAIRLAAHLKATAALTVRDEAEDSVAA